MSEKVINLTDLLGQTVVVMKNENSIFLKDEFSHGKDEDGEEMFNIIMMKNDEAKKLAEFILEKVE